MRGHLWIALCVALVVTGCGRQAPPPRQVELVGQILEVRPATTEVVIKHQDVKNFMPGMTMPFKVSDPKLLDGKQAGDLVTATLVVEEVKAYLTTLTKTGHTDLPPAAVVPPAPVVLEPGDTIKDSALIDQDGKARPSSSWRGHRVALTFMYTRCPLPDFCPMMDRHFAAVQKALAARPDMADVRLVSMTLDPEYDTPAVLKAHAQTLGSDPKRWTFVTAPPADAQKFAEQFGVFSERNPDSPIELTHNLRTAVIDAEGRLVRVHNGTNWTPDQLVADLSATAPAKH
jgi:protein SCO1/2